jgi:hypothetical protein
MSLAKSLSQDVSTLHDLHRQRDKLKAEAASLQTEKERCGDLLFQTQGFNQYLEEQFTQAVHRLDRAKTTYEAAQRKCDQQEFSLRDNIPPASNAAYTLWQALHKHVEREAIAKFHSLIDPRELDSLFMSIPSDSIGSPPTPMTKRQVIEILALSTPVQVHLQTLRPNVIKWLPSLNGAKPPSDSEAAYMQASYPDSIAETPIQGICRQADDLADKLIQLQELGESYQGFQFPPFLLQDPNEPQLDSGLDYRALAQMVPLKRFGEQGTTRERVLKQMGLSSFAEAGKLSQEQDQIVQKIAEAVDERELKERERKGRLVIEVGELQPFRLIGQP